MTTNKQPINTNEEVEILRSLLDSAQSGQSVVKVDDAYPEVYKNKLEPRTYTLRRLKLNNDRESIVKGLTDNYDMSENKARNLVKDCRAYLDEKYRDYAEHVAQRNIETLQLIVDEALESGDRKTAIQAITELDRITGLHSDNFVINNTTINSDAPIEIVFK